LVLVGALALAGCSGNPSTRWKGPGSEPGSSGGAPAGPVANATINTPADGATNVSTAVEVAYAATNASSTSVSLTDASGASVSGALRGDGSAWLPDKQLKYGTQYTLKVTATGADGKAATATSTFTTMAKPGSLARVSSIVGDGQVIGVGMMMIVSFGVDVAKDKRADVQKRLFVTSDPPQEGVWNWFSSKEVHFRPKTYWKAGTKISLRAAVGGLSVGGKWYAEKDIAIRATVGSKLLMEIDNKTKLMTVTKDGSVIKTIPVSLGKSSTPSDSGNFIVMVKNPWEWFDSSTYGVPVDGPGGYRTKVYWPQRITWSGQYVHAAPWSEKDQGKRNVSHGCVNISLALGEWLYSITHIGDPVIVRNTESKVKYGDGWTDWELSWEQYLKGSAIPYSPPTSPPANSPASPSPSTSPSA
jgi:lipoprotein-anchoring transpeptidase ErfK/SrfK